MARRAPPPEIKAIVRSDDRRHPRPATLRRGGQTAGARLKWLVSAATARRGEGSQIESAGMATNAVSLGHGAPLLALA
jgi:hypothetical protein